MGTGSRQDQWLNTLTIDGASYGTWDTLTGGDVQASEVKFKPGGMQPEISLGGSPTTNNITMTRLLVAESHWDLIRGLMSRAGKAPCTVARQPLDTDGNPYGKPMVYRGNLLQVMPGDADSNATSQHMWTVVISVAGSIA